MQPDVLVARYADFTLKNLPVAPLLAVEVLSRTLRSSTEPKKAPTSASECRTTGSGPGGRRCADGIQNEGGGYAQVARVVGDEPFEAREPFDVTVVPARLLDGLRPRQQAVT